MGSQPMLLAPTCTSPQLAMMSSSPSQIFLSPITGVNMDLPGQQTPTQVQLQQQQQQQYQQQQIVLQHDNGMGTPSMLLAPTSPSPQLAMMGAGSSQIFLSPISMDLLPQQQQQQLQCQQQQQ
ncbi:putative mediator of RNA polymerase II transcription subunit 21, partial [Aplysia californica]|uniref:Mediator of RNA polymerase II transcription subunit 21 n=1 Tax=Aplysia californica TaxID=6500 RepID=A0ABM1AFE9_APLCA